VTKAKRVFGSGVVEVVGTANGKHAALLVSDLEMEGTPDGQSVKKRGCGMGDDILEWCMRVKR
jgi:hypothetical protein